jgi:hypothetical protein
MGVYARHRRGPEGSPDHGLPVGLSFERARLRRVTAVGLAFRGVGPFLRGLRCVGLGVRATRSGGFRSRSGGSGGRSGGFGGRSARFGGRSARFGGRVSRSTCGFCGRPRLWASALPFGPFRRGFVGAILFDLGRMPTAAEKRRQRKLHGHLRDRRLGSCGVCVKPASTCPRERASGRAPAPAPGSPLARAALPVASKRPSRPI